MSGSLSVRSLPEGREGRLLAAGILVFALVIVWFAAVSPLLGLYAARQATLEQRIAIEGRMAAIAADLPATQQAAQAAQEQSAPTQMILSGGSDPIAGAALESLIDQMAHDAGANLVSTEALAGVQMGAFRRVGLHVTVRAPWFNLMNLLAAIERSQTRMTVGDLQLQAGPLGGGETLQDLSFSVMAIRAGTQAPAPPGDAAPENADGDSQ